MAVGSRCGEQRRVYGIAVGRVASDRVRGRKPGVGHLGPVALLTARSPLSNVLATLYSAGSWLEILDLSTRCLRKLDTRQTQWHLPSPRREPLQRAARPRAASRRPSRVTAPDRRSPLVPSQRLSSKSQSRLPTALQRRRSASTPKRSSTFPPSMPSALLESRSPTVSRRERLSSTTRSL